MGTIRIIGEDVARFRLASHDLNPLHTSAEYARRTIFGEPVVYGILGTLAALDILPERPGEIVSAVELTFHRPIFTGIDYPSRVTTQSATQATVVVEDSGRSLLTAKMTFTPGTHGGTSVESYRPRESPLGWRFEELRKGVEVAGRYFPDPDALAILLQRWRLHEKGIAPAQAAALLWSSYLVGMELPGERATYHRVKMIFEGGGDDGPIDYRAKVRDDIDERFDTMRVDASLERGGRPFAKVELETIVRRDPPTMSLEALARALPCSDVLRGKTALVTGGARGLGAALVAALVSQGCDVILNYRSSTAEAEAFRFSLAGHSGVIRLKRGDAADAGWCGSLRDELRARPEGLDILICNASPPIRPLHLEPGSLGRARDFLNQSFDLVAEPLAAVVDLVAARSGWCVIISSEYARTAPADFPHYVAAKCAIEGLARSVASRFPKAGLLLVRPPRLLTDQTNTAAGRRGALSVEAVASTVVDRLRDPRPRSGPEVLEAFSRTS
jgi:NAD(P)-dependent dehydrogenase (short-subunit alcohol dehydrogenase family)